MRNRIVIMCLALFTLTTIQGQKTARYQLKYLSDSLTTKFDSDSLKLVSIFKWVIDNIEYDMDLFKQDEYAYPEFNIDPYLDSAEYLHTYIEEVARLVLESKKGICDGYSNLMYSLCEFSGLECEIVSGKVSFPLRDDLGDHAWNAVKLNGTWYLLDATWASGHVNLSRTRFEKEKDMFFFLTPPELLIYDHLPNNLEWTLLDKDVAINRFYNGPALSTQPFREGLVGFYPNTETIHADTSKPIVLVFEFEEDITDLDISISGWPVESQSDYLNIEITRDNYDSLQIIYPELSMVIPKIDILQSKISGKRAEYTILPLTSNLKEIAVYLNSLFPSIKYTIDF